MCLLLITEKDKELGILRAVVDELIEWKAAML